MGEQLEREVSARMRDDGSLECVTSTLELFGEEEVVGLIESILVPGAQGRLERLARASYVHAFGFSKLVLLEEQGAYKVRLHAWPRGAADSDVHDHRWNFGSRVLRGGFRFEEYAVRAGQAWHCYRYLPTKGAAHFTLEGLGTRDIECVRRGTTRPGAVYALGVGTAHCVSTHPGEPTLSLVLQGRELEESTTVLTPRPRTARAAAEVPVERLDASRYRRCLERIRACLMEPARGVDWAA